MEMPSSPSKKPKKKSIGSITSYILGKSKIKEEIKEEVKAEDEVDDYYDRGRSRAPVLDDDFMYSK